MQAGEGMTVDQTPRFFPRAEPKALGLSPEGVNAFIEAVQLQGVSLHSFLVLRGGHVVAEAYWEPYGPHLKHTLYSLTKSFTSITVGIAAGQGLLSADDRVAEILGDKLGPFPSENLLGMTIHDLLTMSAGHDADPLPSPLNPPLRGDVVGAVLAAPVQHAPGSKFAYSNAAMQLLAACFLRKTGTNLSDFAAIHLFEPLGITDFDWERFDSGLDAGGWGLRLKPEDILKFAQLLLARGAWDGRQIVPAEWVDKATSKLVENAGSGMPNPDWEVGYGYLFWQTRGQIYRGDGAMSQFMVISPRDDLAIVTNGEYDSMQQVLDLMHRHLLESISPIASQEHYPVQPAPFALQLRHPAGQADIGVFKTHHGKRFALDPNVLGISEIAFGFDDAEVRIDAVTPRGLEVIRCGTKRWITGPTGLSAQPLHLASASDPLCKLIAGAVSKGDDGTLNMEWRFPETAHSYLVSCVFSPDGLTIDLESSISKMSPAYPQIRSRFAGRPIS